MQNIMCGNEFLNNKEQTTENLSDLTSKPDQQFCPTSLFARYDEILSYMDLI